MSDFIGIDTRQVLGDIARIDKKLAHLVKLFPDAVVDAVNPYIVSVMQQYDPYKKITRRQAYGRPFQTVKQRKWFFWALNNGMINQPYKRTQGMRKAWKIMGQGQTSFIANESEAAQHTMGNRQANLHTLMGWSTAGSRLKLDSTRKGIVRSAVIGTRKAIKQAGL